MDMNQPTANSYTKQNYSRFALFILIFILYMLEWARTYLFTRMLSYL